MLGHSQSPSLPNNHASSSPSLVSLTPISPSASFNLHPSHNPASALMAGRATVVAPPSLSTVTHSDDRSVARARTGTSRQSRGVFRSVSHELHPTTGITTAAPISTRTNASSSSKTWAASNKKATAEIGPEKGDDTPFTVHPTFTKEANHRGDVLVKVQGVEFYAHKHILIFASPFFASLLEGGWKESRLSMLSNSSTTSIESSAKSDESGHSLSSDQKCPRDAVSSAEQLGAESSRALGSPAEALRIESGAFEPYSVAAANRASYYTARVSLDDSVGGDEQATANSDDSGVARDDPATENSVEAPSTPSLKNFGGGKETTPAGVVSPTFQYTNPEPGLKKSRRRSASLGDPVQDSNNKFNQSKINGKKPSTALDLYRRNVSQAGDSRSGYFPDKSANGNSNIEIARAPPSHESEPCSPLARLETLATPPGSPSTSNRPLLAHYPESQKQENGTINARSFASSKPDRLGLASPRTKAKGSGKRNRTDRDGLAAVVVLQEEEASTFHDFLFHSYPHLDLAITWWNCGPLLRFAEKFEVPQITRGCVSFLRAALAGRPIEAMRLAELHQMDDIYKEASRHVLDNYAAWEPRELECLSKETLLKLERKRTWFLERMLKLGLCNPARDYECHANCPDPSGCARALQERWQSAYANAFRFSPPQPSVIFRHLRELDGAPFLAMSACQSTARAWVQVRIVALALEPILSENLC
ncbi:hypothetical protein IE53DRAFT_265497 [Violaceomyces palustris]|uniref:Uncharacterized protein n=1 Tax=Violaceomyces palustris TaxID=1673888 RepID=A0ACD0P3P0_9BASI|nr:hypothetical protein IE53DRAFT_265497 [Violaceomyces palustris]